MGDDEVITRRCSVDRHARRAIAAVGARLAAGFAEPGGTGPAPRPEHPGVDLFGVSGATARQRGFVEWSEDLCRDGAHLLAQHVTSAEWITARTDRVTAPRQDTLVRTTRLSVDVAATALALLPQWRGLRLLPVTSAGPTLPGQLTAHHGGERVRLIGGRRERSLVAAGLVATLRAAGVACPPSRAYELVLDAMLDAAAPTDELGTWPRPAVALVRAWADTRLLLAAVQPPEEAFDHGWRTDLTIEARLDVPVPHDRVPLGDELREEARAVLDRAGLVRRAAVTTRQRLEAEHVDDVRIRLGVERFASCGRYRLELEAPPGMIVARSALLVTSSGPTSFDEPTVELVVGAPAEDGVRTRIDKVIPQDWRDPASSTLIDAHVDVVLRPRRGTALPAPASIETAGALAATALVLALAREPAGAAALAPVLLLPAAAAAGLAERLDRGITHTVAATTRHRLVAGAAVGVLAAALAASGAGGPPALASSLALAVAAWILALTTLSSKLRTADAVRDLRTTVRPMAKNDAGPARWTRIDKKLRL